MRWAVMTRDPYLEVTAGLVAEKVNFGQIPFAAKAAAVNLWAAALAVLWWSDFARVLQVPVISLAMFFKLEDSILCPVWFAQGLSDRRVFLSDTWHQRQALIWLCCPAVPSCCILLPGEM